MVFKNFKSTYKLILVLAVLVTSCGDDDGIDPSQLVSNFEEPYLGFLIEEDEFIAINGPAELTENFNTLTRLYYNQDLNGVDYYTYAFITSGSSTIQKYYIANVKVATNQQNLAHLKSVLTGIYGEPVFIDGEPTSSSHQYRFQLSPYAVNIVYSKDFNDPNANIVVTYTSGGSAD
jgi:hypothetical protein